ncbi:hypothetical protein AKI39_19885 [Bordetella sp. H567]|uniref:type VI secretion system membrane subunit TssM n=1 Tax=Bordetella sp. H567 TaxID=1697043 RepID=UPI00081CE342|nr:type VI secretion system membrane subunit TssM [Bordetella sp. H567]AOB32502.1 hypothetical protein AKI39_19885 [Bordetella sp. H567]
MVKRISPGSMLHTFIRALAALFGVSLTWIYAPALSLGGTHPFADPWARVGLIALLFAMWFAYRGIARLMRGMPRLRVVWAPPPQVATEPAQGRPGTRQGAGEPAAQESAAVTRCVDIAPPAADGDAVAKLERGFDAALKVLGRGGPWWRLGRNSAYRLPWYVVLGSAGSGKSALLNASGLEYARDGMEAGLRSTDPCRWWIADEAVLLEVGVPGTAAGQAGHGVPDHAFWSVLLRRLRGARRRCPVNGAIVTLAAGALFGDTDGPQPDVAALRSRLKEMRSTFGVHFPVYVVITQCDRVAGFRAYFDDLDAARRAKVFGLTFPVADTDPSQDGVKSFPVMCRDLVQRLHGRMVRILGSRATLDRRAEVYGFPAQFDLLTQGIARFLAEIFTPSPQAPLPWLRGVYFTSAEQAGGPVQMQGASPLATSLATSVHAAPQALPHLRSYFTARLLRDLVLQESGLAFRRAALVPQSRWARYGAGAVLLSCAIAVCTGVGLAAREDEVFMARVNDRLAVLAARARQGVSQDQPASMLPLLDAARELAAPPHAWPMSWLVPWRPAVRVAAAGRERYLEVLRQTVVPVIARRAMDVASDASLDAAQRYQALRVYLMLGTPRVYDAAVVMAWTQGQADRFLANRAQRQEFMAHIKALFGCVTYAPHIQLDPPAVARVRAQLMGYSTLDRLYADILGRLTKAVPDTLSVARMGGVNAPLILVRASGRWLTEGVPGAYTVEGYRHYRQLRDAVLAEIEKEGWVLGMDSGASIAARRAALKNDLDKLYFHRYIAAWDDLLNDMRLVPLSSSPGDVWLIRMLAAGDSPLRLLLKAAAVQTTLQPGAADPASGAAAASPPAGGAPAPSTADGSGGDPTRGTIFGSGTASASPASADTPAPYAADDDEPTSVDRHFDTLHRLFVPGSASGVAPMDEVQGALKETAVYLEAVQAARQRGLPMPAGDALDKLRQIAQVQPEPLRQMLQSLSANGDSLALNTERRRLNDLWQSSAVFCHAALDHRYPLDPYASVDVTPDDFARVFGPGGAMDSFFQANLLPYIDTGTSPWKWRAGATTPKMSDATLMAFQRAAAIRAAFFPDGGKALSIRFLLQPLSLDASITRFSLALSGTTLDYAHGPVRPVEFQWPSGSGTQSVRLAYQTGDTAADRAFTIDGPWALFRLLDRGRTERVRADRYKLTFNLGGRSVTLQLDASSVINPFALNALRVFRCPEQL